MIEVAVQGATLKETFAGGPPGVSSKQITTPPSTKCKAEGKGIYRGSLSCTYVLSAPSGFDTPPTLPVTLSISPGSQKVKADGQVVVIKGDKSATVPWSFTNSATAAVASGTVMCEIDDPGQTKMKVN